MEKVLLLPSREKKVRKAVIELEELNVDFKNYEELYKAKKNKLQDIIKGYADKNKLEEFGFDTESGFKKVRPVISKKITWDIEKLSKKLDKKVLNEIINKKYSINDINGLITYLKSCGVNPKEFKKYLNVEETVNNKKVDELGQLGEIDIEQLSGCYELQANFSYVKISNLEASDEEDKNK